MSKVLLLASGLSAKEVTDYDYKKNGWIIVAVNNGWLATENWDHWMRARDYNGHRPSKTHPHQIVTFENDEIRNFYGGPHKCGMSITLSAAYYALYKLKPTTVGFLGADMNYTPDKNGNTHIYGLGADIKRNGISDPDRMVKHHSNGNPNYLTDIYMRYYNVAKESGCSVYNFSSIEDTRLPYPKAKPIDFESE